jgi:hypothetical protein
MQTAIHPIVAQDLVAGDSASRDWAAVPLPSLANPAFPAPIEGAAVEHECEADESDENTMAKVGASVTAQTLDKSSNWGIMTHYQQVKWGKRQRMPSKRIPADVAVDDSGPLSSKIHASRGVDPTTA